MGPLLTPEACHRIHRASLDVLEAVGVRVDDEIVLALLRRHGARDGGAPETVRIPRELVAECLATCPPTARLADRRGRVVEVGPEGGTVFWTGNALHLAEGRGRRELLTADLAMLCRVADACAPASSRRRARPPSWRWPRPWPAARLGRHPPVSFGYSIVSPLHWTATGLGVFRATAGHGLPLMINSEPMGGGTAPVTLAGCLVLANADALSGVVIAQLLERGRPVIFNLGFAHVLDMSTSVALTGAPENALLQSAGAELARFHRLPSASWMSTEAMTVDAQAAAEKAMTGLAHAAHGVNVVWGAGNLESTLCMSPEMLVIDDEIIGSIRRFAQGIGVSEETLALDLIRAVGHRADFLTTEHTLRHFRRQIRHSRLPVRCKRERWEREGSTTLEERAAAKVRDVLAAPAAPRITDEQERALRRVEDRFLAAQAAA